MFRLVPVQKSTSVRTLVFRTERTTLPANAPMPVAEVLDQERVERRVIELRRRGREGRHPRADRLDPEQPLGERRVSGHQRDAERRQRHERAA